MAALLMMLAVAASAYDPPSDGNIAAIRKHSEPNKLGFWIGVDQDCDISREDVIDDIDAVLIRSRIEKMGSFDPFVMTVEASCLKLTNGSYVFTADAYFTLTETIVGITSTFWDLNLGNNIFGISPDSDRIADTILDVVTKAVTDFIYAHRQAG